MSATLTLNPLTTIERDVRRAAGTLGEAEVRFLVDTYYALQKFRIGSTNQVRSILRDDDQVEPHETLMFFSAQFEQLEHQIKGALDVYSAAHPVGEWARMHVGIGPVISAGLLAHVDLDKCPHASSLWRFAGLAPGQRRQKGVRQDWNASLKVLCWKLGDSFVKFQGKPECYYGHLYVERKHLEVRRNEAGENAETARRTLKERQIRQPDTRKVYESGKLPDGRIDLRARRYAVKRYLAHHWNALWWYEKGTEPPNPYVQEHLGHVHIDPCPIPYPTARK